MAITYRGQYVGAPASSHVIPLGSGSAGRDILVAVSAAAGLPAAPSGWTREVYGVHTTAGAVYRLPAAGNTGAVTTLTLTLSGARQCSAVVWEDDIDGTITIASSNTGFVESATLTSGPYTVAAKDAHVLVICAAGGTATVAQSVTAYSGGFSLVGQSTPTTAENEDATASVGALETGAALSAASVTLTYAASWYKVHEAFLLSYDQLSGGPVETPTTLTLANSPSSPDEETLVTLSATATPSGATGTVTFSEGATTLGTAPLSGGVATLSARLFTVGTHNVSAALDGTDGVWADSSDTHSFAVTAAAGDGVVGEQILVYGELRHVTGGGSVPYSTS